MKKLAYTIALVALFSVASNAQDTKKGTKQEPKKQPTSTEADPKSITTTTTTTTTEEPKKSGTRMAINEKGLPGTKSNSKKESTKESPKNQPGTSKE